MINVEYSKTNISWEFNRELVRFELENIIYAAYVNRQNYINIQVGLNFITTEEYFHDLDGKLLLHYNQNSGLIEWNYKNISERMIVENLSNVGFFPNQGIVLVRNNDGRVKIINLLTKELCDVKAPDGHEMIYFQESDQGITIVCDGDENHTDKYGRNRHNFELDIETGNLKHKGLSY